MEVKIKEASTCDGNKIKIKLKQLKIERGATVKNGMISQDKRG